VPGLLSAERRRRASRVDREGVDHASDYAGPGDWMLRWLRYVPDAQAMLIGRASRTRAMKIALNPQRVLTAYTYDGARRAAIPGLPLPPADGNPRVSPGTGRTRNAVIARWKRVSHEACSLGQVREPAGVAKIASRWEVNSRSMRR